MNFDNKKVPEIVKRIPEEKLLIIDWKIHATSSQSVVYQDFGESVLNCFNQHLDKIKKYNEFTFLYPDFTYHPKEAIKYFSEFCDVNKIKHRVIYDYTKFRIRKGGLYFLVSDRTLASFLDQCATNDFEPGKEVGVISYNETPMKKYVKNGITVISTDFELMGQKAAEFVIKNVPMQFEVPTALKLRSSL